MDSLAGRVAALVAGLSVVVLLFAVPSAHAAKIESPHIVSPAPDSLITGKRLTVRMDVGARASQVSLRLAGRKLKTHPVGGGEGVRVARTRLRGLPTGRVTLMLRARGHGHTRTTDRTVILGRHTRRLLRSVTLPHRAVGAVRMHVRLGGQISQFKVTVNGRHAKMLRKPHQPGSYVSGFPIFGAGQSGRTKWLPARSTTIPLSADDSLRPGRNRVVVLAYRARTGRWDRVVRDVWISRSAPMVAAGQDRRVPTGATVRLDGSMSRPGRRGEKLAYRWHIVSQPGRSGRKTPGARLVDPDAVRPRLVVHRPGIYKVALRLRQTPEARAPGEAVASAAGESGPVDVATVEATERSWPWGYRMITNPEGSGWHTWIELAPLSGENFFLNTNADELQVIVLDRSTLAVKSYKSYPGAWQDCAAATRSGETSAEDELVIVAGYCQKDPLAPSYEPFSAIYGGGHRLAANAGHQIGQGAGGVAGELRRSVSKRGGPQYGFVFSETEQFDTYEQEGETIYTNVGGHRAPIEFGGGARSGISITALNPALETIPSLSGTYAVTESEADLANLGDALARLKAIEEQDPGGVLLLQTVGDPHASSLGGFAETYGAWAAIGEALEAFGGTPAIWDGVKGTGNYALVGTVYGSAETRELRASSTVEQSAPLVGNEAPAWAGTARGLFGRGTNGLPIIRASDPVPHGTPGELLALVEEEPQAWPLSDPPHEAALIWISQKLDLGDPEGEHNGWCFVPRTWDVRAAYCNRELHEKWGGQYFRELEKLNKYECPTDGPGFDRKQCEEVATQLEAEFDDVGSVYTFVESKIEPLIASQLASSSLFTEAVEKLQDETFKTEQVEEGIPASGSALIDGMTTVAQDLDHDDVENAVLFGLVEAVINVGLAEGETEDGEQASSYFTVSDKWNLSSEMVTRLEDAVNGVRALEPLLLTDWHKLSTVAEKEKASWGVDAEGIRESTIAFQKGSQLWLYEALVPATYHQLRVPLTEGGLQGLHNVTCHWKEVIAGDGEGESEESNWQPFRFIAESGAFFPPWISSAWVIANPDGKEFPVSPTESLTNFLFRPYVSGGAGIQPASFFTWGWYGKEKSFQEVLDEETLRSRRRPPTSCKGT